MLLLVNFKTSFLFLIISLLLIIILYYIQKRTMNKIENYENLHNTSKKDYMDVLTKQHLSFKNLSNRLPATCNTEYKEIIPDSSYVSANQKYVGKANPKTLIPPVVTPPAYALDYWAANNLINNSHINVESQHDTYLSGYTVSNRCEPKKNIENYEFDSSYHYNGVSNVNYTPLQNLKHSKTEIESPIPVVSKFNSRENYKNIEIPYIRENESGWVNTSNGYNSKQLFDYDLPTNLYTT